MSYCRFENTMNDLRDCLRHINREAENKRDDESRWEMIQLFTEVADECDEASRQEMLELFRTIGEDYDGDVCEYAHNEFY